MNSPAPLSVGNSLPDRILALLGAGLSGSVVASAVGVTPAYVSQLLEDEDFRLEVSIRRAGKAEVAMEVDSSWDSVEKLAIDKMKMLLPMINKPGDLIRIAQIANAAKRTSRELEGSEHSSAPTVSFTLPAGAQVHFQMNSESQVIQIDGRSTEALPIQQLQKRLAERKLERVAIAAQPTTIQDTSGERKRVQSTLDKIGFSEEAEPVVNVLAQLMEQQLQVNE